MTSIMTFDRPVIDRLVFLEDPTIASNPAILVLDFPNHKNHRTHLTDSSSADVNMDPASGYGMQTPQTPSRLAC